MSFSVIIFLICLIFGIAYFVYVKQQERKLIEQVTPISNYFQRLFFKTLQRYAKSCYPSPLHRILLDVGRQIQYEGVVVADESYRFEQSASLDLSVDSYFCDTTLTSLIDEPTDNGVCDSPIAPLR